MALDFLIHQNKYMQSGPPPAESTKAVSLGTFYVDTEEDTSGEKHQIIYKCIECTAKEDGSGFDLKWDTELWNPDDIPTVTYGDIEKNVKLDDLTPIEILKMMLCPYVEPTNQAFSLSVYNVCTKALPTSITLTASWTYGTTSMTTDMRDGSTVIDSEEQTGTNGSNGSKKYTLTTGLDKNHTFYCDFTPGSSGSKGGSSAKVTKNVSYSVYDPVYCFSYNGSSINDLTASIIEGKPYVYNTVGGKDETYSSSKFKVDDKTIHYFCIAVDKKYTSFKITKIIDSSNADITTNYTSKHIEVGDYVVYYDYMAAADLTYFLKTYNFTNVTRIS